MIRGTTPKHMFTLPFDMSTVKELHILYAQGDNLVLKKTLSDCTADGCTVSVILTQQETMLFSEDKRVEIQIRVLTTAGQALASRIREESVYDVLDDEVLK